MLEFVGFGIDVDSGYYKVSVVCIFTMFISVADGIKIGWSARVLIYGLPCLPYVIGQAIYIFILSFVLLLLLSFFFPRLISAVAD